MSTNFRGKDRATPFIFPPSIEDWLPENQLARFVADIVGQLDISIIRNSYSGKGSSAYDPEMLLALLFYGYATGVYSSRKIEKATYDSVAFRYISANEHPDHDTIANFRKRFITELSNIFVQILQVAHDLDLLQIGKVSIDGTKIKANASKHKALSYEYADKLEKKLREEVSELLHKAEEADNQPLEEGLDIPEELSMRENRLERIAQAKAEIEKRAAVRHAEEQAEYEAKLKKREEHEKATGRKPKGKAPNEPEKKIGAKEQVNLTDEESRIMPTSGKGFVQGYNAQASVDVDSMMIIAQHLTQNTNDRQEIFPAIERLKALPPELGKVTAILADAGYYSDHNVNICVEHGISPYICPGREAHNSFLERYYEVLAKLPENASPSEKMRHSLKTRESRALYAKRKSTVEPVFGIIKSVMGFRSFLLRGLKFVQAEWNLVCIAWNLKRLHALKPLRG